MRPSFYANAWERLEISHGYHFCQYALLSLADNVFGWVLLAGIRLTKEIYKLKDDLLNI